MSDTPPALSRQALGPAAIVSALARLEGWQLSGDGADVAIQVLKAMPDSSQKRAKPCDGADEVVHVLPHSLKVHESPKALVSIEV